VHLGVPPDETGKAAGTRHVEASPQRPDADDREHADGRLHPFTA